MAETKPSQGSGGGQSSQKSSISPRGLMPYAIATGMAACVMGWYFFAYVPQHLEYFMGLRFRSLAIAGGQLKSKTESLSEALKTASGSAALKIAGKEIVREKAVSYLSILVPDVQLDGTTGEQPGTLSIKGAMVQLN